MLLKEKLFLSNCDSVRRHDRLQLKYRLMTGVLFAEGIVLSPNVLIDNQHVINLIREPSIKKWFTDDEGTGRLEVRGLGLAEGQPLVDYFQKLRSDYRLSRLGGRPKSEMTISDYDTICRELEQTQHTLTLYGASAVRIDVAPDDLTQEIRMQLGRQPEPHDGTQSAHHHILQQALASERPLDSRSRWYDCIECLNLPAQKANAFRLEVVDAAYNRLFVTPGEAFVMDRITGSHLLPRWAINGGLSIRALRRERQLLGTAWQLFNLVTTLGSEGIARVLMDEALNYCEDRAKNHGMQWCQRHNWFGLYPHLTRVIGVEIKS